MSPLTADHVNPERPWPAIDELAAQSASAGFTLKERLTIYPEYVLRGEPWLDPRIMPHVQALADPETGWRSRAASRPASAGRSPTAAGTPPADARTCTPPSTPKDAPSDRRSDFSDVYGDWDELREHASRTSVDHSAGAPSASTRQ